jgi:hypothetical protein
MSLFSFEFDVLDDVLGQLFWLLDLFHNCLLELHSLVFNQLVLSSNYPLHVEKFFFQTLGGILRSFGFEVSQELLILHFIFLVQFLRSL